MKKGMNLLVLALLAGLTACASDEPQGRRYRYAERQNDCNDAVAVSRPDPAPAVRYQAAPSAVNCGGCQPTEYTVRTPVKVVYKNTTYRTVYEPRTYQTTSYETRPFNRAEACEGGNCVNGYSSSLRPVAPQTVIQQQVDVEGDDDIVYEK